MRALLIVYDNGSHIPFFPQGAAYIAASLKATGHKVYILHQDIYRQPDNKLQYDIEWLKPDVVGLGFNAGYYQFSKCLNIAQAVNRVGNRSKFIFVLGGHGPAAAPEYFLNKFEADLVCHGEGEGPVDFLDLPEGVYYQPPIQDVDSIPWPAYDMFPIDVYRLIRWPTSTETDFCMPILSGRGCPYKCTFCYRMVEGDFRPRSPESVIDEMQMLYTDYGINHFQFSDELFMSSEKRIDEFCEELVELRYQIPNFKWDCNGRLNFAKPNILSFMKRCSCEYINYGIESLSNEVLKNIKKGLTVKQIDAGIRATLDAGITPGLNIMWGNPGDNTSTLYDAVQFLMKYDTCAELRTIRPMTPYPGSQAFKDTGMTAKEFYEEKHINSDLLTVNLTDLSDKDFHKELCKANFELVRNYYNHHQVELIKNMNNFYNGKNPNFRGFRAI